MADTSTSRSPPVLSSRPSPSSISTIPSIRRRSTASLNSPTGSNSSLSLLPTPSSTSPRVQLIPHVHRMSYDSSLSQTEREVLDSTSFDALDLSSKDFDFEDIFTYDKPQKKLSSVIEVSSTTREKDWSNFYFSHYNSAASMRQKVNRSRNGIGEMYVKNKSDARKR